MSNRTQTNQPREQEYSTSDKNAAIEAGFHALESSNTKNPNIDAAVNYFKSLKTSKTGGRRKRHSRKSRRTQRNNRRRRR